jgi:diguanylate cyclase
MFSFRKKETGTQETVDWASELERCENRRLFLLLAVRTLLQCIRQFALEIEELNGFEFQAGLAELAERMGSEEKLGRIQTQFQRRAQDIGEFAEKQRSYIRDRETEFKAIIDILTKAMVAQDCENREYNLSFLKQSKRLEEITLLDDIRRLKQALSQEVEQLRAAVRAKEARDSEQIETLARQVTTLNSELQNVRNESERDSLTGVLNRRAFDRRMNDLVTRNTLKQQEFTLLLIDLDDFKRINDTHGHPAGDRILLAMANKFRQAVRSDDVIARYGGEEFAIILPGASLRNGIKKGKQICDIVASSRYRLDSLPSAEVLSLTLSIGVAAYRKGDHAAALISRADKALYLAKCSGKNRVRSEKDLPETS